MDPWKESAAWDEWRSVVRDWASLESKSATMSDDLYRSVVGRRVPKRKSLAAPAFLLHVAIMVLDVLRMFRSG